MTLYAYVVLTGVTSPVLPPDAERWLLQETGESVAFYEVNDADVTRLEEDIPQTRIYESISSTGVLAPVNGLVIGVALSPPTELEGKFEDWYRNEHILLLSKVPGWAGSRRYRLIQGDGPSFVAFHSYLQTNGAGVGKSAAFDHAVTTTDSKSLVASCKDNGPLGYERRAYNVVSSPERFSLLRVFSTPDGGSAFETQYIEMSTSNWIGSMSSKLPAIGLQFQRVQQKHVAALSEPHVSARVHIEISIDAATRLRTSDGQEKIIVPGDIVRYEDTTGKGHSIEPLEEKDERSLIVLNVS